MSKKVSPNSLKAVEIIMRESAHDAFGGFLLKFVLELFTKKLPGELSFRYKIPAGLCSKVPTEQKAYLPTSSILALFDELSTHALVGADKSFRPGVSVHLSTDLIKPAYLNDEVIIVTKADKIGKTMGFSTMEMYNTAGELVAKGKHIKFMPIGFWWDFFTTPFLFPMTIFFYNLFRGKKLKTSVDHLFISSSSAKKNDTLTKEKEIKEEVEKIHEDEIGSMFKALSVTKVEDVVTLESLKRIPGHAENSGYYSVTVKKNMMNPLGSFHGGALAATLEDACRAYKEECSRDLLIYPIIQSFDIRYLSAVKGQAIIQVHDDVTSTVLLRSEERVCYNKSFGAVINAKTKQIAAEFTCTWQPTTFLQ